MDGRRGACSCVPALLLQADSQADSQGCRTAAVPQWSPGGMPWLLRNNAPKYRHFHMNCRKELCAHLSASSKTTYSTVFRLKPATSARWWASRPGVATITSGFPASSANCASMESPPTRVATLRAPCLPRSRTTRAVCSASSRVGAKITDRAPARCECSPSLQSRRIGLVCSNCVPNQRAVCSASSRVGARITGRAPARCECSPACKQQTLQTNVSICVLL